MMISLKATDRKYFQELLTLVPLLVPQIVRDVNINRFHAMNKYYMGENFIGVINFHAFDVSWIYSLIMT